MNSRHPFRLVAPATTPFCRWPSCGARGGTCQTPDEVQLERIARQKQTQEEKSNAADFKTAMAGSDKSAIVGSLRDMLYKKRMERQLLAAKGLIAAPERPPDEVGGCGCMGGGCESQRAGDGFEPCQPQPGCLLPPFVCCELANISHRLHPPTPPPPCRTAACPPRVPRPAAGCRPRCATASAGRAAPAGR